MVDLPPPHLRSARSILLLWLALFLSWVFPSGAGILPAGAQGTVDVRFPVSEYYQKYAAQDGNPVPATGRLLLLLPPHFDPARSWPILVVTSTNDYQRASPHDAPWYRATAQAEGWIVLATDATVRPHKDTTTWRLALLAAGLEVVHRDWPGSAKWPVAFAGISGGAKGSCWMGAMLAQTHSLNIRGFFLSGINDDRMREALKNYPPTPEFLQVPVWISSGTNDSIAPPRYERTVEASFLHDGFRHVRFSSFVGGHEVDRADVQRALRWFRELGGF